MEVILLTIIIGIMLFAAIAAFAFWIWAIIDCIGSDMTTEQKLLWTLIIVLLNIIGAILYFVFSNKEDLKIETKNKKGKKLTRSSEDSILFGVCGGIAKYFNVDSAIVRIAWVLMTFLISGFGIFFYIIAAIIMPLDKKPKKKETKKETKYYVTIFIVLFIIISIVLSAFIASFVFYSNVKEVTMEEIIVDRIEDAFEKEAKELILESYNYNEYAGSDLMLVSKQRAPEEYCEQKREGVMINIFGDGCVKYVHSFEVDHPEIESFEVETIVVRGKIVHTTYTEIPSYEFHDCKEEQRYAEICPAIYAPVCGYYEEGRETFSNECIACANPEIIRWKGGEC